MKTIQNNEPPQQGEMSRGEFLRSLGLSSAALMAFYFSSCTNSKDDPAPTTNNNNNNNGGGGNTSTDTIDLTKELTKNGDFIYKGDIIVFRIAATNFVALSKICTHQGCTVAYRPAANDLNCDCHGSVFNSDGSVKNGPASSPLKVYKTELQENNTKLKIIT